MFGLTPYERNSNVDESAIDAEYTNGILRLTLPKKEKEQPKTKRIEIK